MIEVHGRGGYGTDEMVEWEGAGWYAGTDGPVGLVWRKVEGSIGDGPRLCANEPEDLLSEPADDIDIEDYNRGVRDASKGYCFDDNSSYNRSYCAGWLSRHW